MFRTLSFFVILACCNYFVLAQPACSNETVPDAKFCLIDAVTSLVPQYVSECIEQNDVAFIAGTTGNDICMTALISEGEDCVEAWYRYLCTKYCGQCDEGTQDAEGEPNGPCISLCDDLQEHCPGALIPGCPISSIICAPTASCTPRIEVDMSRLDPTTSSTSEETTSSTEESTEGTTETSSNPTPTSSSSTPSPDNGAAGFLEPISISVLAALSVAFNFL